MNWVALSLSRTIEQHARGTQQRAVSFPLVRAIARAKGSPLFAESSAGAA